MTTMKWTSVIFMLSALQGCTVIGGTDQYVDVQFVRDVQPSVEAMASGVPQVVLPKEIGHQIRGSGFRLPGTLDYKLDWAEYRETYPVPFLALGDFNHDGAGDVGALVVSQASDNIWKLMIFERVGAKYRLRELAASPETVSGSSSPRDLGPIQRYAIIASERCTDGKPCLVLFAFEVSRFEYLWKNEGYIEVNTAD